MGCKYFCDRCGNEIQKEKVRIEYREGSGIWFRDFHIDCFNYQFSCDIRKIKEVDNK